jgi:YgiT-type zinc finger domain-containing protein
MITQLKRNDMKCVICKNGETAKGQVTVTLERGESIVVIKGVVGNICNNCGEYYLDQETTKEVLQKANEASKNGAEIEVINMRRTA